MEKASDLYYFIYTSSKLGVDIVLNSLAGDALLESVKLLAYDGCFVELGKTALISGDSLKMLDFIDNKTYRVYDLDRHLRYNPHEVADRSRIILDMMEKVSAINYHLKCTFILGRTYSLAIYGISSQ
jgi:NADPH:quinone reductase-like Zn-dependent oxidoreductase